MLLELINLKCKNEENKKRLFKAIIKLKWVKKKKLKIEDINVEFLEKLLNKIEKKYPVILGYIINNKDFNLGNWGFMIKQNDKKNNKYDHIETVYSQTIDEGLAKVILVLYAYIVKGVKFNLK